MSIANPELKMADEFLQFTNCNIFLTGKAGTGKTTFLKNFKKNSPKRLVVTAPTGVAAINAGGVTLHSFFQMPFGPFVPGSEAFAESSQRRFNREKINIIKSLDLLVIDEISMVRADLLDGVDAVLRRYRRSNLPFGGVQLLMIGDLHQLSPVVKDTERHILSQHYDSAYFFSSNSLKKTELLSIELKHIYRQSDNHFISLLNSVRDNNVDNDTLAKLNKRYIPDFSPKDDEGYITLCTHNRNGDAINFKKLAEIKGKTHRFNAEIDGDFPEHTYPTPASLELKVDAQVMFVRNDPSIDKNYFNGKIGKITRISGKEIWVKCKEDNNQIIVEPAAWENIKYKLDEKSGEIKEHKIGTFEQIPLKLAWAITIHKSQGLTFDRAIIDAQAAFAHGQVYVALSRCRTLEGMVLSSTLMQRSMKTDPTVLRFTEGARQNPPGLDKLTAAKISYQQHLLLDCYDFKQLRYYVRRLASIIASNPGLIQITGIGDMHEFSNIISIKICDVSENFKRQLQGLFTDTTLPTDDPVIVERIGKAADYFQQKLVSHFADPVDKLQLDTDNKEIRKKMRKAVKQMQEEGMVKIAAITCCQNGFSPEKYLRSISAAEIRFKKKKTKSEPISYTEADVAHPELFRTLRQWRTQKSTDENIAPFQVLHQKTLVQIVAHLPDNPTALKRIQGIGKILAARYGEELISMVSAYREKHKIEEVILPSVSQPQAGSDPESKTDEKNTKDITLELFEKGLTVAEIAKDRSLVTSTIEGHLAFFVTLGQVKISQLLPTDKQEAIEQALVQMQGSSFAEIKLFLGDDYSYGEIKLTQAHLNHLKKKQD